ncbi:MAG: hypothetical protein ABW123_24110, partial [Cystobacter sp.]
VQGIVEQCVAQAHADVNESYQRGERGVPFKNKKFPSDAECDRVVRLDDQGEPRTLAQELGLLKHAAAFACITKPLPDHLRRNVSIEPRYKGGGSGSDGAVLTNNKHGSLKPDLVVHATRNASELQCVFEFKFPCYEKHRLEPMGSPGVKSQLDSYQHLSRNCPVFLVTPAGLRPFEAP